MKSTQIIWSKLPKYFQSNKSNDWLVNIISALNTISDGELSDPIYDSENRGLTLVRLMMMMMMMMMIVYR